MCEPSGWGDETPIAVTMRGMTITVTQASSVETVSVPTDDPPLDPIRDAAMQESLDEPTDMAIGAVIKSQEEQQITLTVAYPAMRKDGHGEFASAETVEKAAHGWMATSRRIGLYHAEGLVGFGTVVESGLHRGPDWVVKATDGSEQRVHAGDWLLATKWDDRAWDLIKTGRIDGLSIDGRAARRKMTLASAGLR